MRVCPVFQRRYFAFMNDSSIQCCFLSWIIAMNCTMKCMQNFWKDENYVLILTLNQSCVAEDSCNILWGLEIHYCCIWPFSQTDRHWCGLPHGQKRYATWRKNSWRITSRSMWGRYSCLQITTFFRSLMCVRSMRRNRSKLLVYKCNFMCSCTVYSECLVYIIFVHLWMIT